MKLALPLILLALAAALAFLASPAYAQIELTKADPADGARLDAPPEVVHLCFSQPVDIQVVTSFRFRYLMPDNHALGLRIVFHSDGECVDVFPGLPDVRPAGEYTFEWRVTAAEGSEEGSGTLRFRVGGGGAAATPPPALGETRPPETPPAGGQEGGAEGDDGPDILLMALITIAAAGGAAVLATLGYWLRRRIGFDPHRPPEGGQGDGGDH